MPDTAAAGDGDEEGAISTCITTEHKMEIKDAAKFRLDAEG
jgi:hypothetical protein